MLSFAICGGARIVNQFGIEHGDMMVSERTQFISMRNYIFKIGIVNSSGSKIGDSMYIGLPVTDVVDLRMSQLADFSSYLRKNFLEQNAVFVSPPDETMIHFKKYLISNNGEKTSDESDEVVFAIKEGEIVKVLPSTRTVKAVHLKSRAGMLLPLTKIVIPSGTILYHDDTRKCIHTEEEMIAVIENIYLREVKKQDETFFLETLLGVLLVFVLVGLLCMLLKSLV